VGLIISLQLSVLQQTLSTKNPTISITQNIINVKTLSLGNGRNFEKKSYLHFLLAPNDLPTTLRSIVLEFWIILYIFSNSAIWLVLLFDINFFTNRTHRINYNDVLPQPSLTDFWHNTYKLFWKRKMYCLNINEVNCLLTIHALSPIMGLLTFQHLRPPLTIMNSGAIMDSLLKFHSNLLKMLNKKNILLDYFL
jgi:hypothetical protein